MEAIRPLIIKYIYTAAITIIILTFLQTPAVALGSSLVIALFITLVLYFAGDRYLLPRFGSVATAIANFVLAAVVLAISNAFVIEPVTTGAILAAAAVIGVVEWFFFRYARSEVTPAFEGGDAGSFGEFLGESPAGAGENRDEGESGGESGGEGESGEQGD